jgi:hypothetical protein
MMRWFGNDWGAQLCRDLEHVDTPVGEKCAWCGEVLEETDSGVTMPAISEKPTIAAFHAECSMRMAVGGVNHQVGNCTCCGGTMPPDPPGMSKREAALAAVKQYEETIY